MSQYPYDEYYDDDLSDDGVYGFWDGEFDDSEDDDYVFQLCGCCGDNYFDCDCTELQAMMCDDQKAQAMSDEDTQPSLPMDDIDIPF